MSIRVLSVATPTHGRVLVKDGPPEITLVGFHGYAQSGEDMMEILQRIPGSDEFTLVSVQALHRFYTRGDQKVVASWMTRQDREEAIADNIEFVDRVLNGIGGNFHAIGFSQGVAMAYRAALLGKHPVAGIIAIGGDVPPDVKDVPAERWPRVLIAVGDKDLWYTAAKVSADDAFLKSHGVAHEIHRSSAGHEATDDMLAAAARFIARS